MRDPRLARALALAVALVAVGEVLAWLLAAETPRGGLSGVVIAEELGTPIPGTRVTLTPVHGAEGEMQVRTDADGRFAFDGIPAGGYRLMCAAQAHAMSGPRAVSVAEGRTLRLSLELPPVEPFMSLSLANEVFTPQEQPQIRTRGFTSLGALQVSLYRIDTQAVQDAGPTQLAALLGTPQPSEGPWLVERSSRLQRVNRYTLPITGREAEGIFSMRLDLPPQRPGVYVAAVENDELQRVAVLTVTDLALVCKWAPQKLLAWAVDINTGQARQGVQIRAKADGKLLGEGVTGVDGLLELPVAGAPGYGRAIVTARAGDSTATVESWLYGPREGDGQRVYCYTDRPAYRPGDEVCYKGIRARWRARPTLSRPTPGCRCMSGTTWTISSTPRTCAPTASARSQARSSSRTRRCPVFMRSRPRSLASRITRTSSSPSTASPSGRCR